MQARIHFHIFQDQYLVSVRIIAFSLLLTVVMHNIKPERWLNAF